MRQWYAISKIKPAWDISRTALATLLAHPKEQSLGKKKLSSVGCWETPGSAARWRTGIAQTGCRRSTSPPRPHRSPPRPSAPLRRRSRPRLPPAAPRPRPGSSAHRPSRGRLPRRPPRRRRRRGRPPARAVGGRPPVAHAPPRQAARQRRARGRHRRMWLGACSRPPQEPSALAAFPAVLLNEQHVLSHI